MTIITHVEAGEEIRLQQEEQEMEQLIPPLETDLQQQVSEFLAEPHCPICGDRLTLRMARRGPAFCCGCLPRAG